MDFEKKAEKLLEYHGIRYQPVNPSGDCKQHIDILCLIQGIAYLLKQADREAREDCARITIEIKSSLKFIKCPDRMWGGHYQSGWEEGIDQYFKAILKEIK